MWWVEFFWIDNSPHDDEFKLLEGALQNKKMLKIICVNLLKLSESQTWKTNRMKTWLLSQG